jgi:hypothetical protein
VDGVEESLRVKHSGREVRSLLDPLQSLVQDANFWNHALDGLAVLAAPGLFQVVQLQRPVREFAVVAETFYLKPLLRVVQSADRFQVLCLTKKAARVYEGNRYALDALDADGFPATLEQALGEERTEKSSAVVTTGQRGEGDVMHYGLGSRKDVEDQDTERFFRAMDREVASRYSKPSGLPLILVAAGQHQPVFRAVSQNAALLPRA